MWFKLGLQFICTSNVKLSEPKFTHHADRAAICTPRLFFIHSFIFNNCWVFLDQGPSTAGCKAGEFIWDGTSVHRRVLFSLTVMHTCMYSTWIVWGNPRKHREHVKLHVQALPSGITLSCILVLARYRSQWKHKETQISRLAVIRYRWESSHVTGQISVVPPYCCWLFSRRKKTYGLGQSLMVKWNGYSRKMSNTDMLMC